MKRFWPAFAMSLKQYQVIARPLPTKECENPAAISVQVFAEDEVCAKSEFWGVARRIARLKKSHGEVLAVRQVIEPEPHRAKTYGVWLTFKSTRSIHNIYKEYRDCTTEGAVQRLYQEMAGTHNVHPHEIIIVKICEIKDTAEIKHHSIKQFTADDLKFPIVQQPIRPAHPQDKKLFSHKRPTLCGF